MAKRRLPGGRFLICRKEETQEFFNPSFAKIEKTVDDFGMSVPQLRVMHYPSLKGDVRKLAPAHQYTIGQRQLCPVTTLDQFTLAGESVDFAERPDAEIAEFNAKIESTTWIVAFTCRHFSSLLGEPSARIVDRPIRMIMNSTGLTGATPTTPFRRPSSTSDRVIVVRSRLTKKASLNLTPSSAPQRQSTVRKLPFERRTLNHRCLALGSNTTHCRSRSMDRSKKIIRRRRLTYFQSESLVMTRPIRWL